MRFRDVRRIRRETGSAYGLRPRRERGAARFRRHLPLINIDFPRFLGIRK